MLFTFKGLFLLITATTTALMAGLFFAWYCSVIPGLSRLTDATYISAMQSINRAIQNPMFFFCFFGTAFFLPLCTYLQYNHSHSPRFWFLLAATVIYLAGVMGVTIFGNIPLNEGLDTFQLTSSTVQDIRAARAGFEDSWNALNNIRTVSSILAILFVIIACLNPADS
ncbi:anthrone oxygenase family protein [Flavitalea flava]